MKKNIFNTSNPATDTNNYFEKIYHLKNNLFSNSGSRVIRESYAEDNYSPPRSGNSLTKQILIIRKANNLSRIIKLDIIFF